jgi:hypothetical protein
MSQSLSNPPSVVPSLGTDTAGLVTPSEVISGEGNIMAGTSTLNAAAIVANRVAAASTRTITAINLDGVDSPRLYWQEVARPNLDEFRQRPTARSAANAASSLWALVEWIWCERHPGRSPAFTQFREDHIRLCDEIAFVQDIAEAWKHRHLSRPGIRTARTNAPTLEIALSDGTVVSMANVFDAVATYIEGEL